MLRKSNEIMIRQGNLTTHRSVDNKHEEDAAAGDPYRIRINNRRINMPKQQPPHNVSSPQMLGYYSILQVYKAYSYVGRKWNGPSAGLMIESLRTRVFLYACMIYYVVAVLFPTYVCTYINLYILTCVYICIYASQNQAIEGWRFFIATYEVVSLICTFMYVHGSRRHIQYFTHRLNCFLLCILSE